MKFKVTDTASTWFGKEGILVANRGGLVKLRFQTFDKWGKSETTWHFTLEQIAAI